ncbi:MAG: hypothetical protein AAGA23_00755 [Pseudomonadota bacterium]
MTRSTPSTLSYGEFLKRPLQDWHLREFNPRLMKGRLIRMSRENYRRSSFLDDRIERADRFDKHVIFDRTAGAKARSRPKLNFIFHVSFCGSTLLSRCLDMPRQRLVLREPFVLRQIWEVGLLYPQEFDVNRQRKLLKLVLPLLAKPSEPGETVCIKPSNLLTDLAEPMLQTTQGKAICLYVPAESFLLSMADKQAETIRRVVEIAAHWSRDLQLPKPATIFQSAALFWYHQIRRMHAAMSRYPQRTASLDFETFVKAPRRHLRRVCAFFGEDEMAFQLAPLQTNAKAPWKRFTLEDRLAAQRDSRKTHGADISAALVWLEKHTGSDLGASPLGAPLAPLTLSQAN